MRIGEDLPELVFDAEEDLVARVGNVRAGLVEESFEVNLSHQKLLPRAGFSTRCFWGDIDICLSAWALCQQSPHAWGHKRSASNTMLLQP